MHPWIGYAFVSGTLCNFPGQWVGEQYPPAEQPIHTHWAPDVKIQNRTPRTTESSSVEATQLVCSAETPAALALNPVQGQPSSSLCIEFFSVYGRPTDDEALMSGGTASSGENLLCTGTLKVRDAVGRPSRRNKSAGWVPVGRCGESAFSSLAFLFCCVSKHCHGPGHGASTLI